MKNIKQQFKDLFPIKVKVSQNIINKADIDDIENCIGSLALRKGLGAKGLSYLEDKQQSWGVSDGEQTLRNGVKVLVTARDSRGKRVDMMSVTKPFEVTFHVNI